MGYIASGRVSTFSIKNRRRGIVENNVEFFVHINDVTNSKHQLQRKFERNESRTAIESSSKHQNAVKQATKLTDTEFNIFNLPLDVSLKILTRISLNEIKKTSKNLYELVLSSLKNRVFYQEYMIYHLHNNDLDLINFLYRNPEVMEIVVSNIEKFPVLKKFEQEAESNNFLYYKKPQRDVDSTKIFKITDPKWNPEIRPDQLFKLLQKFREPLTEWLIIPYFVNKMVKDSENFFKFNFFEIYQDMLCCYVYESKNQSLFRNLSTYFSKAKGYLNPAEKHLVFDEVEYSNFIKLLIDQISMSD